MRLTPFYEQGIEQATQRGQKQAASKLVLRQLQRRLGEIPQNLRETINNLSVEQLEDLGEALLDFESQDHLIQWLDTLK